MAGAGSQARRREAVDALFGRATAEEQRFLQRLVGGELRQGALDGVMADAVAPGDRDPAGRRSGPARCCAGGRRRWRWPR